MPAVSSYVGYSLEEPWGEPRVVLGLAAQDAEQLAGLLQRYERVGPVYATAATMPGARDLSAAAPPEPLPVPRQGTSPRADEPLGPSASPSVEYDVPLYRQAAAAVRAAAAARFVERQQEAEAESAADSPPKTDAPDDSDAEDLPVSDEVSAAVGVEVGSGPGDDGAGDDADSGIDTKPDVDTGVAPGSEAGIEFDAGIAEATSSAAGAESDVEPDQPAMPQIHATDVLEPLPELSAEPLPKPAPESMPETMPETAPESVAESVSRPEVASGASYQVVEMSELDEDQDPMSVDQSEAAASAVVRRGKVTRASSIPRLPRTKRPAQPPARRANG
jgi:hypothetical protein